ncbi:helix-turn-helix domain-containing protein [Olivibacter domesticus]|uniref:AraC-type DNA-binding protein n=1 Tax=Olivibacter domesticus TaxID=407022 RepID=A0A1H7JM06_OLID1|nr:helix-turn-helix domain-containing protein [Olivibacter domesticus]SEK75683.1 AraC-type DNA-binding protein [Olivibacter domesticus]
MESQIQLEFPQALGDIARSHTLPQSATYRLNYAHCNYWQHSAFTVVEQYYQTKDIFLYLGEVKTDIDLSITLHCNASNLYWVYQLEDEYLLVVNHEKRKAQLKTKEKSYRAVYVPVGDHNSYFEKDGRYLVFYFVVDKDLLLRFQDTSLRFIKDLLNRLKKEHPEFAFSLRLPIDAHTIRHLNKLLHIQKLDALELEGEIPQVIIRLIVIARTAFYRRQQHIRLAVERLAEIRQYIKDSIEVGNIYTISYIAYQFDISPYRLRYSHKQAYEHSLQAYITDLRLKEVHHLIKEEGFRPLQAAYAMGYTEMRSFRKQFIKHFGITPNDLFKSL